MLPVHKFWQIPHGGRLDLDGKGGREHGSAGKEADDERKTFLLRFIIIMGRRCHLYSETQAKPIKEMLAKVILE